MRKYKNELGFDFIGGQKPLTKKKENAISAFIKAAKQGHKQQKCSRKEHGPLNKR